MRRRWKLALALAVVLLVAVVLALVLPRETVLRLDAPRPVVTSEPADTLPRPSRSTIEGRVTYDLSAVTDSLEVAIPRVYGDLEQKIPTARNERMKFAFLLRRSPFRVKMVGQTVRISADVEYSGRIWYDPTLGPEVEMSCGTGGDPPRRARLTLECRGQLTREWGLRTRSRLVRLEPYSDDPQDRCRLSFLRIDVTERVFDVTRRVVAEKLDLFDEAVARWPVRGKFEKVWCDLQVPLRLTDSLYMTINPSDAEVGSIGARGDTVFANLRLFAEPRVVSGSRPTPALAPLPPLRFTRSAGHGARVLMDASCTYPIATLYLRKALVGRSIEQMGRPITIRDVAITGIGGGRVALGVRLTGAVEGRLYFTGTPRFEAATHEITVPDLEYDVGTARILVKGYEWLNGANLRDFLREQARLPDSMIVEQLSRLAEQGMNRDLPARGTHLSGRIADAGVIDVRATLRDIRVRALAEADLGLSIRRSPSVPRPPAPRAPEPDSGGKNDDTDDG